MKRDTRKNWPGPVIIEEAMSRQLTPVEQRAPFDDWRVNPWTR